MIDVKETVSKHLVSLGHRRWEIPRLDPIILNKFLRHLIKDDDTPVVAGKKRCVENTDTRDGPSKRQKFTDVTNGTRAQTEDGEEGDVKVPAFKHTYDIAFTLSPPDPDNGHINVTEVYRKEVEALRETLSLCSQSSAVSDRGDIALPTNVANRPPDDHSWCTLDVYLPCFGGAFLHFRTDRAPQRQGPGDRRPLDPIGAAHLLGAYHGVELTFSVRLWPTIDPDHSPEHALPLKISIDMEGSLCFPKITHAPKNVKRSYGDAWNALIKHLFPPPPMDFPNYRGETDVAFLYSILEPAPSLPSPISSANVQPVALLLSLLPFQRRSVLWMLQREGKTLDGNGQVVKFIPDHRRLFWEEVELGGQTMYLNRLKETLSMEPPPPDVEHPGGSLNEAPGLGKTVECMALILLNPDIRRNPSVKRWDSGAKVHVREVHTTLIITPATLASQWQDELKRHTPSLKVFFYEGWSKFNSMRSKAAKAASRSRSTKSAAGRSRARSGEDESPAPEDNNEEWCSYINEYDVCITTYNVLTNDLHVARPPARRPRRDGVSYVNISRQRSPLVTCEWYRVIMDEVQMVGGGKTEEMVSLIPRLSSFAVSGTPARSQVPDLIHVLKFLRVEGIPATIWSKLQRPEFVGDFVSLFRRLAIRTTKSMVRDELAIPEQTRYLVPIDLGKVEKHFYDQNMEQALLTLGFDARGVTVDESLLDPVQLRSWIRKLRGICTHPQVGQLQSNTEKKVSFKSIEEVLDSMREANWKSYMEERRSRINHLTVYAQLQQSDQEDLARYQHALETLLTAEIEANALIKDLNAEVEKLNVAMEKLRAEKREAEKLKVAQEKLSSQSSKPNSLEQDTPGGDPKGKGKERESGSDLQAREDDIIGKRGGVTNRLREAELLLHKVTFLIGDVYHTLGTKYSKEEESAYAKAELIRRKLLKVTEESAGRAIAVMAEQTAGLKVDELLLPEKYLQKHQDSGSLNEIEEDPEEMEVNELIEDETEEEIVESDEGSIYGDEENGKGKAREKVKKPAKPMNGTKPKPKKKPKPAGQVLNELIQEGNTMITDLLNAQTNLLWQWRGRLAELLTRSISSESGEDADGKEYARSLETQGEAETFLHAYSVLLNDRREALFAEKSLLAAHDGRGKFKRATAAAMRALDRVTDDDVEMMNDLDETRPEDQVLRRDLMEERLILLDPFQGRALKSIVVDLTTFALSHGKKLKVVATDAASSLRDLISSQMKHSDKLDADLVHFRRAFNERVLYFRQLQEISDSVVEAEWEGSLADAVTDSKATVDGLKAKVNSLQSHQRYLDNLSGANPSGEEDGTCIVCRCEFLTGFVTPCAHVFCEDCLKAWLSRKEGKVCPVCRVPVDQDQLQRFCVQDNAPDPGVTQGAQPGELAPKSRRVIEYNNIDTDLFKAISEVECLGSYGTKIEMLIRHLLYLQKHEPDAKSIVFSAWADSLRIIDHALRHNGIPSIRIDKGGKGSAAKLFDQDPGLRVMLLHGERENAGLNIVCASRVFLLESVVNHAFEVQAIARIDRLSQTRSTQVFCYYAKETIEKNILDLAARQGLSLYTKENSAGILTNAALASTTKGKSGQKGDFISSAEDMLAILFPHMFEDLEFLLPPENDVMMDDAVVADVARRVSQIHVNAEAGPSRLR